MKCQHCGHLDTEVLETRDLMRGTVVRRRRGCGMCGGTFATYEIDGGIWGTVKKWALGDRAKALDKKHALRRRDEDIVAMIKSGRQLKDIAKQYGIAATTVCHVARKAGIPSRQSKTKPQAVTPWSGLL